MQFLQIFLVTVFIITCIVLMFFILIQSGKGGSLGIMGGGTSNSAFGSSTVDVVEKITWWGIVFFFVLALISAIVFAVPRKKIPNLNTDNPAQTQTIPENNEQTNPVQNQK
ncbi:MAG: hypothetical protein KatS3mg129_0435 [Leptospiraceae bacterium]|nr:MAG: hypothetical protein KatS3mg129_0435 [Leptospiraceae bacterium]